MSPSANPVDREDVLLLVFDSFERVLGKSSFNGVTRLEKLIFLLGAESGFADVSNLFGFRPYKFGPYSKGVYDAAEFLQSIDLLSVGEKPYYSYFAALEQDKLQEDIEAEEDEVIPKASGYERLFRLTPQGKEVAEKLRSLWAVDHPQLLRAVDDIIGKYGSLPLNQIIRYVYRRFPAMAEESIHPEAKRISIR